jgi:hypothetical protein
MATNSENKPQRRIEDHHPDAKIDWNKPGAPAVPLSSTAGAAKGGITNEESCAIPPLTAPAPLTDERALFEAWAGPNSFYLKEMPEKNKRGPASVYYNERTQHAWEGWQACASMKAAPAPQQSELTDAVKTWPERIWLQYGESEPETYPGAGSEITWCEDNINGAGDVEYVRADLAKAAPAAPVQTKPTDLSKRLREAATAKVSYADARLLIGAAEEIERYYGGMLAWKATANEKDADIIALRHDLAEAEACLAAPVQAEQAQPYLRAWLTSILRTGTHDERVAARQLRNALDAGRHTAAPALPAQAEQVEAVRAATDQQANVMPPFAAPAGQHDAGNEVLSYPEVVQILVSYGAFEESQWGPENPLQYHTGKPGAIALVRTVEAEVARRFRAQGGNTSAESSEFATKEAAAQVPAEKGGAA